MFGKHAPRSSARLFARPVSIIAHRGGAREAPENTLAAFKNAADHGFAVECDVRLSGDGYVVVFHDETLERTTDGRGLVADKSLEELQALDAGNGERIPAFVEVLDLIGGRVPVIVEVKCKSRGFGAGRLAKALVRDIRAMNAMNYVVVASFNPVMLHYARRMMPSVLRGLIFSKRSRFGLKEYLGKPDFLMPDFHLIDEKFVGYMHAKGYRLFPWTVDEEGDARRMVECGIDGIVTNRPDFLSSTLG